MRPARRSARWLCTASAVMMAAAVAGSASADGVDITVTGEIHPGALTISPIRHRIVIHHLGQIRGGWRRATVTVPITVTDARGSGAGWTLTLSASAGTVKGRQVHGLVTSVWGVQLRCVSCTRPRSPVGFPLRLYRAHAVRAFTAARGSGMGRMTLTAQIAVTVPRKAPGGAYVLYPRLSQATGP
jgi:hypothetical protein